MLTLKNIKKIYKNNDLVNVALNNVNLNFKKSEFVSILGPSGSGKTTLLNVIGGLDYYTKGDLIINGKSTKDFTDSNWDCYRNSCVGFIFQNYNLIENITVYKNVELSLSLSGIKNKKNLVFKALKNVGLKKEMNKKVNELSGGQKQRVAIARALVNDPDIILADEPTGALDSKTSTQIMEIIKKISSDKLVIMVTHNEVLAKQYSSRIIEIKDGSIISDSRPFIDEEKPREFKIKKTKMSYLTAIMLSLNNIRTKKVRTFLTSLASSIGIIGIALILSVSNGFKKQIDSYEKDAISSFPIIITNQKDPLTVDYEINNEDASSIYPYSNDDNSNALNGRITSDFLNYLDKLNDEYLNSISYYRLNNLNMLTFNGNSYNTLNNETINLVELPSNFNNSSLKENYDLIKGKLPTKSEEVVLITDNKNRVDKSVLDALLGNVTNNVNFDDILGKELKLINNDDFYEKITDDVYVKNVINKNLYENKNNKTLRIVGILKEKSEGDITQNNGGFSFISGVSKIGYTKELTNYVITHNRNSKIVKSQTNSMGIVFMGGMGFKTAGITKDMALTMLGLDNVPYAIYIYPRDFNGKDKIISYLNKYNDGKSANQKLIYHDYSKEISSLSKKILDAIATILILFSSISLVASSIMIGIIIYVSVIERTKEIGILKALGARKKDILRVFNSEGLIIGLSSGIFGILITKVLLVLVNYVLTSLTGLNNVAILSSYHAVLLIILITTLTLTAGIIPSLIASKKQPVEALK